MNAFSCRCICKQFQRTSGADITEIWKRSPRRVLLPRCTIL
jgi:hypothetical protein